MAPVAPRGWHKDPADLNHICRAGIDGCAGDGRTFDDKKTFHARPCRCGGTGPRLAGTVVALYPDVADQIAVVAEGRNGMRGFADRLGEDEIVSIVAFTRAGF